MKKLLRMDPNLDTDFARSKAATLTNREKFKQVYLDFDWKQTKMLYEEVKTKTSNPFNPQSNIPIQISQPTSSSSALNPVSGAAVISVVPITEAASTNPNDLTQKRIKTEEDIPAVRMRFFFI